MLLESKDLKYFYIYSMNVSFFNDKRIMTMLNQSYNFESDIVVEIADEALKRRIISKIELKNLLSKKSVIRNVNNAKKEDFTLIKPSLFSSLKQRFNKKWKENIVDEYYLTPTYGLSDRRKFKKKYS